MTVNLYSGQPLVLAAVIVTSSPPVASLWRNPRLGIRFWMAVGDLGRALAMASFVGCLVLAIACLPLSGSKAGRIGLYAWLNVATLVLSMFVPAVAARW